MVCVGGHGEAPMCNLLTMCKMVYKSLKLEWTEGCICYGLDVDEEPFNDLDEAKKREVFDRMVEAILKDYDIQNITIDLLRQYGEYKHIGHCDECGDNISSFTLEI